MHTSDTRWAIVATLFTMAGCGGGGDDPAVAPDSTLAAAPGPGGATASAQVLAPAGPDCPHPDWVQGRQYAAGSIVTYQGSLYFAKFANPGYVPTISTYFWAPHPCAPPPAPGSCVYPAWVQGLPYTAGSIVTYEGRLYAARYDNPGYTPTVSTYFWSPYTCSPPPDPATCTYPAWMQGWTYPAGSIVAYQGGLYIAKFANPGYTPTISTYFWAPHACAATPPPPPPPPAPTPAPPPAGQSFAIESQGETRYLVMNWWRGDPALEGNFRQVGICTGPAPTGNCTLGARKTFRPQGFYLQNGMLWLDVPQYVGNTNTYDHYPLPVEAIRPPGACTFSLRHIRTHGPLEFPLNPPGLEILPHTFTMTAALCSTFNPADPAWVQALNVALDQYLGPDPAPYTPDPYPYGDPRTGADPSQ